MASARTRKKGRRTCLPSVTPPCSGPTHHEPPQSRASAKVNLTLRILGKRADGYHDLVSLVAFADIGDDLAFIPGGGLELDLTGPNAAAAGAARDNLVLIAARALAERIDGLKLGRFELSKHLPVGAGLGGGSSDAAAALRLLAKPTICDLADPRILIAAGEDRCGRAGLSARKGPRGQRHRRPDVAAAPIARASRGHRISRRGVRDGRGIRKLRRIGPGVA